MANVAAVHFSPRQCDVLRRIAQGQTYKEIAADLRVNISTVKFHLHKVFRKTNTRTSAHAVFAVSRSNGVVFEKLEDTWATAKPMKAKPRHARN